MKGVGSEHEPQTHLSVLVSNESTPVGDGNLARASSLLER